MTDSLNSEFTIHIYWMIAKCFTWNIPFWLFNIVYWQQYGIRHAYTFRTRFTPQLRVCKKSHIGWDNSTQPSIFAIVAQYGLARTSVYERCYVLKWFQTYSKLLRRLVWNVYVCRIPWIVDVLYIYIKLYKIFHVKHSFFEVYWQ